jgi:hypothetical protein
MIRVDELSYLMMMTASCLEASLPNTKPHSVNSLCQAILLQFNYEVCICLELHFQSIFQA